MPGYITQLDANMRTDLESARPELAPTVAWLHDNSIGLGRLTSALSTDAAQVVEWVRDKKPSAEALNGMCDMAATFKHMSEADKQALREKYPQMADVIR
ncbi:hypothetical protein MKEN_00392800 [Mycena kentingensis (nom. inval.)]|nr:hypothetical protein MKEN_00392800 [Mycena kentingensis (nom. inval.)]